MRIIKTTIILFFIIIPCLALSDENVIKTNDVQANESKWVNIKKLAVPIKADIPEKYNNFVKVFNQYWAAAKEQDWKKTYKMEASSYKKTTSFDLYEHKLKKAVQITGVKPFEIKSQNDKEVIVKASYGYKAGFIDTVRFIDDRWIKEKGSWKHVPEKENG